MIHQLKQSAKYFKDVISIKKTFEVRKNDRNFKVGDFLALNELDEAGKETGKCALFRVEYILDEPEYCKEGYVTLSIKPCKVCISTEAQILDEKIPEVSALKALKKLGESLNGIS